MLTRAMLQSIFQFLDSLSGCRSLSGKPRGRTKCTSKLSEMKAHMLGVFPWQDISRHTRGKLVEGGGSLRVTKPKTSLFATRSYQHLQHHRQCRKLYCLIWPINPTRLAFSSFELYASSSRTSKYLCDMLYTIISCARYGKWGGPRPLPVCCWCSIPNQADLKGGNQFYPELVQTYTLLI